MLGSAVSKSVVPEYGGLRTDQSGPPLVARYTVTSERFQNR